MDFGPETAEPETQEEKTHVSPENVSPMKFRAIPGNLEGVRQSPDIPTGNAKFGRIFGRGDSA